MRNEKESVGKHKFSITEVKEILDSIFAGVLPDKRYGIVKILKPQFRVLVEVTFPDWVGEILGMSMHDADTTKMEIQTTTGFYDVIDLDKDVPSIVVPLELVKNERK